MQLLQRFSTSVKQSVNAYWTSAPLLIGPWKEHYLAMLTVGVSLSAVPGNTWVAVVGWDGRVAELVEIRKAKSDEDIVDIASGGLQVGIDCPLGWPTNFVEFLRHSEAPPFTPLSSSTTMPNHWLPTYRLTDFCIQEMLQLPPRSVCLPSDKLGGIAMRCAQLQWKMARANIWIDRAGIDGALVEVYPAASLRQWMLPFEGYQGASHTETLERLVEKLASPHPHYAHWLDLARGRDECAKNHHALDALISALTARAASAGRTIRPNDDRDLAVARREGWIHVPDDGTLSELAMDSLPNT